MPQNNQLAKIGKQPKKAITVFLIISTLMLSLALVIGGVYSLYVSIGFSFLQGSAVGGVNTSALYTYSNSGYGTGGGSLVGLIITSIIMLGLGVAMGVIFFKQLPLYRQIKLIAKMPNVKYKHYSAQVKKSVIAFSIIAYFACVGFCIFAIVVASRQPLSTNYKWVVLLAYSIVLLLAIASMTLMFIKLAQLSKIKKQLKNNDLASQVREQADSLAEQKTKEYLANLNSSQESSNQDSSIASQLKDAAGSKDGQSKFAGNAPATYGEQLIDQQNQLIAQLSGMLDKVLQAQAASNNAGANGELAQQENSQAAANTQNSDSIFESGVFELSNALVKLREIHVSGLIDSSEYTQIREKWINAVLRQPLFNANKKTRGTAGKKSAQVKKDTSDQPAGLGSQVLGGGAVTPNADAIKA